MERPQEDYPAIGRQSWKLGPMSLISTKQSEGLHGLKSISTHTLAHTCTQLHVSAHEYINVRAHNHTRAHIGPVKSPMRPPGPGLFIFASFFFITDSASSLVIDRSRFSVST